MRTYTRAGLTPMQNMNRHFSQKYYARYLRAFRKAFVIGGDEAAIRVFNAAHKRIVGESRNHYTRLDNAWVSFCSWRKS